MLVVLEAQKFRLGCEKRPGTSRLIYQGTSIRRGPSFAISLLQKAEEFCWHYLAGSRCFLVKHDTLCTVWIQTSEILHLQPSEKVIEAKPMADGPDYEGLEPSYRGKKYVSKMIAARDSAAADRAGFNQQPQTRHYQWH